MMLTGYRVWYIKIVILLLARCINASEQNTFIESYCGRGTYGNPQVEDCRILLDSFANSQDDGIRVFDEEELRSDDRGSWPGVPVQLVGQDNLNKAVQVPRFFSYNTCNFAIMSFCGGEGIITSMGGTSWAKVNAGGHHLMQRCLMNDAKSSGGVVVIPSIKQPNQGVLSLWMWEGGKYFDAILNAFNKNPAPMIPAPGDELWSKWSSINVTGVESNVPVLSLPTQGDRLPVESSRLARKRMA